MTKADPKRSFRIVELLLWAIFILSWGLYTNNKWNDSTYGFSSTIISICVYIIAVYGNSLWLMPRYFKKEKLGLYFIYSLLFLAVLILARAYIEKLILMPLHKRFYDMQSPHLSLVFLTTLIAFLFGSLLFVAKNYMYLLRTQEELKTQQIASELNLLKQQVQPHFLFNTLNNIYSLAHTKSDNTTLAIEKLASIMRYFNEDALKEKVPLQTEINFIDNYILLEQLRMLHPVAFKREVSSEQALIPPMLLMPFIENLFKHGVDKTRKDNEVEIELKVANNRLYYSVRNSLVPELRNGNGFGLSNLRKRLDLLYGNQYKLRAETVNHHFEASLEIPL